MNQNSVVYKQTKPQPMKTSTIESVRTKKVKKHVSDRIKVKKTIYDHSDRSQGYREYFTQGDMKGIILCLLIGIIFFLITNCVLLTTTGNKFLAISVGLIIGATCFSVLFAKVGNIKIMFYFHYLCLKRFYVFKDGQRIGPSRLKRHVRIAKALRATQQDFDDVIF
jgi:hypothetical protein